MIDSHHHFWNFNEAEFGWINSPAIRRDFQADDLAAASAGSGVRAAISVQARCHTGENDYLLSCRQASPLIAGVVGWLDFKAHATLDQALTRYSREQGVLGFREIIQGSETQEFLENSAFNQGLERLAATGQCYDLLIFADQMKAAERFVARHQALPMVLDHCAKPPIRQDRFPADWARQMEKLAQHPHLYCKLSGLVTEIRDGSRPSPELFAPYVETIWQAFGPERLLFGSDWPVSLPDCSYLDWVEIVKALVPESFHQAVFCDNAARFYRLSTSA